MDANDDPVAAMDALVARLAATLAGGPSLGAAQTTGHGADGRITATVLPDGHVSDIVVEPVLARAPHDDITAGIVAAVNEAVDARPDGIGAGSMVPELKAIQEESLVLTQSMNSALLMALERLKASQ